LEDHQKVNLDIISSLTKESPNVFSCVYVGWYVPRKLYTVLFFSYELISYLVEKGKNSILKKELTNINRKYFIDIKRVNKLYTLMTTKEELTDKIITIDKWLNMEV